jgi:hypothetical protein
LPSTALLHTNTTPFGFGQKAALGQRLGEFLGKNHMPGWCEKQETSVSQICAVKTATNAT